MAIPILSRLSYWDYERIILTFLILVAESLLRFFMLFIPYSYFRFFCSLLPVFNKVPHVFKAEENEKSAPALAFLQDAVSMIESHGYLAEEHTAITEDGYFLVCHRVLDPHSVKSNLYKEKNPYFTKKRPVVLLMHGCMMSSEVWFCHENPKKCYPFILSDLGFDVWTGNFRGNKYSHKHLNLKPNSRKFWDFSLDELAVYDIPTLLNHILQITGQPSLTYIGFSQGTATCFAALSLNSALNDKINFFIALAATTVPRGLERGLAKTLINSSPELIFLFFGRGIFLRWVHFWVNVLSTSFFSRCIDASLKYLFDWDAKNITSRQKLTMYQHLYTFTSVKQIVHWFQIIRSQRFQMYDDGITMVGRGHIPPSYRLSKIRTPAVIFFGEKDTLVNIDNTLRDCYPEPIYSHEASPLRDLKSVPFTHSQENLLFRNVESRVQLTRVSHYEHLDFLWAEDINETVLPVILPLLREKL